MAIDPGLGGQTTIQPHFPRIRIAFSMDSPQHIVHLSTADHVRLARPVMIYEEVAAKMPIPVTPLQSPQVSRLPGGYSLVAVSGNVRVPSRTAALVRLIQGKVESRLNVVGQFVSMVDAAPEVMTALTPVQLSPAGAELVRRIEAADILIIGSPIYRASYTGALKHLFDIVDNQSLAGMVVILAATGGTPLHGLALEHQFRPLLSYFGAVAAATTIYALESDFDGEVVTNPDTHQRVARAVEEAAQLASAGLRRRKLASAA